MSDELVRIPFHGTDLLAVDDNGKPEIVLRSAVESLGLNFSAQLRKLRGRSWAVIGERAITAADGKSYKNSTVDVRTFLMLLATINENNVAEDKRALLIAYQSEVADVIAQYWTDGGAINPRATEDQLDRIARQSRLQMELITLAKGLIDSRHLEAKARIVLARAMGEAPELDETSTPLYVSDFLKEKALPATLIQAKASGFGKLLKALFTVTNGREPDMHQQQLPNGTIRRVCAYTEADRELFEQVWVSHYANVIPMSVRRGGIA